MVKQLIWILMCEFSESTQVETIIFTQKNFTLTTCVYYIVIYAAPYSRRNRK